MGIKDPAPHSQTQNERGRELGRLTEKDVTDHACQMEEKRFADHGPEERGENLEDYDLGCVWWRGSVREGTSICSGMERNDMVAEQKRVEHDDGPGERDKMETQVRVAQQRSAVGHPRCEWAEEGKDCIQIMLRHPPRKEDVAVDLLKMMRQPTGAPETKKGAAFQKNPAESSPLVLEPPTTDKGAMLEVRGDSKTVVDWLNGHAKLKTPDSTVAAAQNQMWKGWSKGMDLRRLWPTGRCIKFVNTTEKPMLGQGK